ncbi:hypothetical protein LZ496_12160 [Sphingomonas sp. NSE70-1]|uniref:Uncharacterized protein n=1 Tax=Sphingomonas caseinilyticus TaxID=2908205 RepID=A0ABT0RX13_9SPHN|nr:hypothetical protein [Sphingomonas caseinilyticus]MCL6699535.1 hypothetical protein [Sphingomonas caseinilyticus]
MLRKLSKGQRRNIAHWAMEFVVVVAGVLLALWLQQKVTDANNRSAALVSEAAIRDELDNNLMILVMQNVVADCRRERLEVIEGMLEGHSPSRVIPGPLFMTAPAVPKHPTVYGFFALDVSDTAWRAAIANGSVNSMEPERYRSIADIYSTFDQVRQALATDREAGNTLQILSYQATLTPELRGQLTKSYFTARSNLGLLTEGISATGVAEQMRSLGWNDRERLDELIGKAKGDMKGFGFTLKPCAKPFVNPFLQQQS